MRPLAVIAEPLAVIAGDDDQRAIHLSVRAQRFEKPRELRVRVGDLAVIWRLRARAVFGRRFVGGVRIVEVEPQEEGRWGGWGR